MTHTASANWRPQSAPAPRPVRMRPRRSEQPWMKVLVWLYGILSIVMVPVVTIVLGANGDPLTVSLSEIGNRPGMRPIFIVWTLAIGAYFTSIVFTLVMLTRNTEANTLHTMIAISMLALLIVNLIPFMPDRWPVLAGIHIRGALVTALMLAATLLMLTLTFRKHYPQIFRKALIWLVILFACEVILYVTFATAWLTEAVGLIGGAVFLFAVLVELYKKT